MILLLALLAASPRVVTLPATDAVFPPTGVAYRENAEAHRIWRLIHRVGPDVVVTASPSLAAALKGKVPVVSRRPPKVVPSPLALERAARMRRSPREFADQLLKVYGLELKEVVYIQAFALMARARLGGRAEVERLALPFLNGDSLAKATSSHFAGHLLFAEFDTASSRARLQEAAALAIQQGALHNEMSDSVFMGCPLMARAGKPEAALAHLAFMRKLCLRADGIYRHSPLNEAAWGRGNAFAALGMALMLEALPSPSTVDFRALIDALLPYQTEDGMWRQVIDEPRSYEEFSATAMIASAIHIGMRRGWLKAPGYQRAVDRAWEAVKERTSLDGKLMDVCESTGKQTSLQAYLERAAIWDRDPRGGAMALFLAAELLSQ